MSSLTAPLERVLAHFPSVLVGYSGGVDSALLAVVARRVLGRSRAPAALGVSASLGAAQHAQARALAAQFDLRLLEVDTSELGDPDYVRNAPSRCYFCKRELWDRLGALARAEGLAVVVDGTNADDGGEHRPGTAAAREHAIRSPLAEAGLTKADVRAAAREVGIPVWDAPAAPCLASRIRYGLFVTPDRLAQVEHAEARLRGLGVTGDLRVRHYGTEARIEVQPALLPVVRAQRDAVARDLLALGFSRVTLDLDGYGRGKLLADRMPRLELLGERA